MRALLCIVLWFTFCGYVLAAGNELRPGMKVSWSDLATGQRFCGTLTTVDMRGYAWVLPDIQTQWYAILTLDRVTVGCP